MNKRAQFFLLAAVIISAVIISLGVSTNRAVVNEDPGSFYDFSYEVKREVGALLDYEIYTGFGGDTNLTLFVDLLAKEIEERSPGSDFIFVYGDGTNLTLRNYGTDSIYAAGEEVVGIKSGVPSRICLQQLCQDMDKTIVNFDSGSPDVTVDPVRSFSGATDLLVDIEGNEFSFPVSDYKQVIFIMQKKIGGDRHVIVE